MAPRLHKTICNSYDDLCATLKPLFANQVQDGEEEAFKLDATMTFKAPENLLGYPEEIYFPQLCAAIEAGTGYKFECLNPKNGHCICTQSQENAERTTEKALYPCKGTIDLQLFMSKTGEVMLVMSLEHLAHHRPPPTTTSVNHEVEKKTPLPPLPLPSTGRLPALAQNAQAGPSKASGSASPFPPRLKCSICRKPKVAPDAAVRTCDFCLETQARSRTRLRARTSMPNLAEKSSSENDESEDVKPVLSLSSSSRTRGGTSSRTSTSASAPTSHSSTLVIPPLQPEQDGFRVCCQCDKRTLPPESNFKTCERCLIMRRAAKERRDGKPVVPRLNGRGVSFKTEDDEDGTPSPLRSARASAHNSPRPEGPLRECRACKRIVVPTYSSFRACESCRHEETAMRHAKMSQRGTPIRRRGRPRKRRRLGWGSDDEDDDDDMLDDEGEDGSEGEIEEVENLASPSTPYKSPPKRSMVIGGFTIGSVDLETMVAGIVDHEFEPMVREKPPPLLSPNREKKIKELDAQDQADIKRPLPQLFLPATVPPPPPKPVLGGAPFLKVLTPPPPESVEREQLLSPSGSPQQKKQAATDADPNFILQLVPPEAMVGLGLSNNKKSPTTTSAPMVFGRGGSVGDTGVLQLAPMTGLTPPLLSPPPPTITSTAAPVEGPQLQLQPTTSQPTLFRPPSENAVLEDETGLETEPSEPVTLCVSCRRPHYQTASTLKPEMCGICLERHEARKMYETRKISVAKRTPIPEPPSSLFAPPPRLEVAHMDVDEHGQGQGQMLGFEMGQEKPKMEEMRRLMSIVAEKGPQPLPETLEDMVFHANISPSVFLPADAMRVDSAPPPPLSESVPSTRPSSSSTPAAPDESEDERLLIGEFKVCRWCGKSHRRRSDTCTSCRHLGEGDQYQPSESAAVKFEPVEDEGTSGGGEPKQCKQCKKQHTTNYQTCPTCRARGREVWHRRQAKIQAEAIANEVSELVNARRTLGMLGPASFDRDEEKRRKEIPEFTLPSRRARMRERQERNLAEAKGSTSTSTSLYPPLDGLDAMRPPILSGIKGCEMSRKEEMPVPIPPREVDFSGSRRLRNPPAPTGGGASASISASASVPTTFDSTASAPAAIAAPPKPPRPRKPKQIPADDIPAQCGRCRKITTLGGFKNCSACRKEHLERYCRKDPWKKVKKKGKGRWRKKRDDTTDEDDFDEDDDDDDDEEEGPEGEKMEVDGSNEVREVPPPPPPVDVSKPEKANIGFGVLKLGVARGDGNAPSEEGVELPRTRLVLIPPSAPPATISPIGPPPGPLTTIPLDEAETPARTNLTGQLKICKMCHKMNVPIDSQFKGCDVCREKRRAMYRQRTERKRVTNGSEVKIEELTYPSLFQPSALVTASPGTSSSSTAPPRLSESISTPSVLSLDSPVSPATMSASMKLCSGCRRVQIPISVKFKTCETCRAKHRLLPLSPSQSSAPSSSSTTLIGQDQDQDQDSTRRTRSSQRKRKAVVLQDNAADEEDEDEVKEVSPPPSYTKLVIRLPARKPLPVVVKEEPQQEELPTFS